MSILSLNLRGKGRDKDDKLLENTSLGRLARNHFRLVAPPQFNRKEPPQPLLKTTPDDEKDSLIKIWRVVMRLTGDLTDYRQGLTTSHQPNLGSVMHRLCKELGMAVEDGTKSSGSVIGSEASSEGEVSIKILPNKPKGGTLHRLRRTLTHRLFKNRKQTIFSTLPLEQSLLTLLDQVHYIIGYGILKPQLRDEIYCLICKQLTKNPYKTSTARLWLLLALMLGTFPPSNQISEYISSFIDETPPLYSASLKKLLQKCVLNGARFQPPAFMEIESYLQKKPIEIQITLMDGTVQTVVADGTSMSRDICKRLCDSLGLRQNFGYSLYIAMFNKVASLGSGTDHVMDAISQCEQIFRDHDGGEGHAPWRLFYRKEIFSPWDDTSSDMMAISLTYAQITRGIMLGEYICNSDQDLAYLIAKQYYIEYGADISEEGLWNILPSYVPPDRRLEEESLKTWRRLVIKAHHKLFPPKANHPPTIDRVKIDVVHFAKIKWFMTFSRYYDVVKLEGPQWNDACVRLAVNSSGVHVLNAGKTTLMEISFADIVTIRGESDLHHNDVPDDIVMFVLTDGSFIKLESVDADDIRSVISYMIKGLRLRSKWAVVREKGACESSTDIEEGDLIELDCVAAKGALKTDLCLGVNTRTSGHVQILSKLLYVIPVLSKPPDETLKPYRAKKS